MTKKFFLLISALLTITWSASARRVGVFCQMAATGTQVSEDGTIRASIVIDSKGEALLEIENLTDKVVYIHRKRSFSLVNGISEPMFIRQSNTESHTTQHSVVTEENMTFNTKTIDSESYTRSHTIYDQRVLPIAPHGRSQVYEWDGLPEKLRKDMIEIGGGFFSVKGKGRFLDTGEKFHKGDNRDYTADTTPLMLAADVEYSFNEKGEDSHRMAVKEYVSSIRIVHSKDVKRGYMFNTTPYFVFTSGKSNTAIFAQVGLGALTAAVIYLPFAVYKDHDLGH